MQSYCVNGKKEPPVLSHVKRDTEWQESVETLWKLSNDTAEKLCVTRCKKRNMFSYYFPFSCGILGRLQDESKLCLTNSPVLFSLHGKLARTADIIRSKTIFFLNIFPVLPPSQADVHCCCSVVYPIRVVSTTSQYLVFCFFSSQLCK